MCGFCCICNTCLSHHLLGRLEHLQDIHKAGNASIHTNTCIMGHCCQLQEASRMIKFGAVENNLDLVSSFLKIITNIAIFDFQYHIRFFLIC